jgi:hypothetical protein
MNVTTLGRNGAAGRDYAGAANRRASGWPEADWTKIPTKNDNLPSKDEIKEMVRGKAAEMAAARSKKEEGRILEEINALYVQFVSHESPDRKALLDDAMKTMQKQVVAVQQVNLPKIDMTKTIFDYLGKNYKLVKGMIFDKAYSFSGGGSVTAFEVTGGGATFDVKQNGQLLLNIQAGCINNNGVYAYNTPEEIDLQKEISSVFLNAYHYAKDNPAWGENLQKPAGTVDMQV